MSKVEFPSVLPRTSLPPVVTFVNVALVTEISETPSLNSSNLFTVEEVIVAAREILYQTPVDRAEPSLPICAVDWFQSCKTPALVRRIVAPLAPPRALRFAKPVVALGNA